MVVVLCQRKVYYPVTRICAMVNNLFHNVAIKPVIERNADGLLLCKVNDGDLERQENGECSSSLSVGELSNTLLLQWHTNGMKVAINWMMNVNPFLHNQR